MNRQSVTAQTAAAPTVAPHAAGRVLQRKCACGKNTAGGGACGACSRKEKSLQRREAGSSREPAGVPDSVHEVLGSQGGPLDARTRSFMEPRFGHDFSGVRVHTDARAAESARAVNALAYTVGNDVVFGAGQYAPNAGEGRRLLAHELMHVVQQNGRPAAAPAAGLSVAPEDSAAEAEANVAAARVSSGGPLRGLVASRPRAVQRQKAKGACSDAARGNCSDEDLLTAVCIGETGNVKDVDGKRGVMYVVTNRVADGKFGADIRAVATASGQFLGLGNGLRHLNDSAFADCRTLAQGVLQSPSSDPTAGAVFFDQSCVKPCNQYCTVYLGDGRTAAHYFARRASPTEEASCKDKKRNPKGKNRYCCDAPKEKVYVLPEVEIRAGEDADAGSGAGAEKEPGAEKKSDTGGE